MRIDTDEQRPVDRAFYWSTGNVALLAVFLAHLGIALAVGTNHERWRDEADVWLFTRDADPLAWWSFLRHSGHPGLWHLLVAVLSNSGCPYASMTYLNIVIVSAGVAVFLRRAPFPLPLKLLLPFGVLPLFEYGVVARSYGLSFTLSMATCAALSGRRPRPILIGVLLALLANTNAHSLILAAGFGLYWLLDPLRDLSPGSPPRSRRFWLGAAIAIAGGLASIAQIIPPDDPQWIVRDWEAGRVIARALKDAYFPPVSTALGGLLGLGLLGICVPLVRRRRELIAFWLASFGGLSFVFVFVFPPQLRHAGFLWIVTTCMLWLERRSLPSSMAWRSWASSAFALSLAFSAVEGVRLSVLDYRQPFSASREAARFLCTLDLESAVVAANPASAAEAVLPYLPIRRFYYPGVDATGSYLHWNTEYALGAQVGNSEAIARTRRAFPEPHPIVFVTNNTLKRPEAWGLTLSYRTATPRREFKKDEHYFIYTSDGVSMHSPP